MKHIVQEIKHTRHLELRKSMFASFFFNNRGAELEKTRLGFYRSVLHQLLIQIPDSLKDLVTFFIDKNDGSGKAGEDWQWLEGDLQTHLTKAISTITKSHDLWLFVDALDESIDATASAMVKEFISLLEENGDSNANFHICFTARHYPVPTKHCEFELSVDQNNKRDIRTYVENGLAGDKELLQSQIPSTIVDRANGIFLWARLALEKAISLDQKGLRLESIQKAINVIPPTLEELFESLISTLEEEEERAISLKIMQWICFAQRALSLDELRWAMVADDDLSRESLDDCRSDPLFIAEDERLQRRLTTLSCGLVEVMRHTKSVEFIHQAVKEFFLYQGLSRLRGIDKATNMDQIGASKEERNGHYKLARTCIRYLSIVELSPLYPFALLPAEITTLRESVTIWHDTERNRDILRRLYELDKLVAETFPLLGYALSSWIPHIIEGEKNITEREDAFGYTLWPLESLFWPLNSILPPEYTRSRWATMLHLAAEYQLLGQLRTILSKGSGMNIPVDKPDSEGQTALFLAVKNGHTTAVRMLLDKSNELHAADLDYKNKDGNTSLMEAAANGCTDMVKIFLGTGRVDVNSRNYRQESALLLAVKGGHLGVVQTLVNNGKVDANSTDLDGNSAIFLAADGGHFEVLRALLESGKVDRDSKNNDQVSTIVSAIRNGRLNVVQALLNAEKVGLNLQITLQDSLILALERGHLDIVRALVDRGNIARDNQIVLDCSLLIVAAERGYTEIVRLFLDTYRFQVRDNEAHKLRCLGIGRWGPDWKFQLKIEGP